MRETGRERDGEGETERERERDTHTQNNNSNNNAFFDRNTSLTESIWQNTTPLDRK